MSFKELFLIWGQGTRERTRNSLEMANFEFKQRNLSEMQRRKELMEMLKWKQSDLKLARKENQKIKKEMQRAKETAGATQWKRLQGAINSFANINRSLNEQSRAKMKMAAEYVTEQWNPRFEETPKHSQIVRDFDQLFASQDASLATYDEAELKAYLNTTANSKVKAFENEAAKNNPVDRHVAFQIAESLIDKVQGFNPVLSASTIKDVVYSTLNTKGINGHTLRKMKNDKKARNQALRRDKHNLKGNDEKALDAYTIAHEEMKEAKKAAPGITEALQNRMINIAGIKGDIGDIEKKLDEAKITPFDYTDIQRRAGEILIEQDEPERLQLPEDELTYVRSLPAAFKFSKDKTLSPHGTIGKWVDEQFSIQKKDPKKKKTWPELLAAAKENTDNDDSYKTAVSMMASRMLRAVEEEGE